jgi:putative lipoprotein
MLFKKQVWVVPVLFMTLMGCATVQAETDNESLTGITWLAEDINGKGVIDMLQTTLEFADDGKIGGNGGCNRYFGSATITGQDIEIGPLGATRMMCPESIMNQEMDFMQALAKVTRWEMRNGLLYMFADSDKAVLRFSGIENN